MTLSDQKTDTTTSNLPNEFTQSGTYQTKGDAFSSFSPEDFPHPYGRDEQWRFTPLRTLGSLVKEDLSADGSVQFSLVSGNTAEFSAGLMNASDSRRGTVGAPTDRPAAVAYQNASESTYQITVPKSTVLSEPIELTITGPGEGKTAYSGIFVEIDENSQATVVLRCEGSGNIVDNHEILVKANAQLNLVIIEDWNADAHHLNNSHIQVDRDAKIHHTYTCFGGEVVRTIPRVSFTDQGGDAELLGLYFADSNQHFEQRLLVDHTQPNCRSNVMYKGALQSHHAAEARTAWVGDVLIRSAALGTDTYETNRNLILTDHCRADSVPNLEIETGDIAGAGHAATVGRFDDEQMFYLQARGIPPEVARKLIVRGFFTEVISRISVEHIRHTLEDQITKELEHTQL